MNARILSIGGSPEDRRILKSLLDNVDAVDGGYDALAALNREPFDLYVLDYWLPDFSGVQLCRDIRAVDPQVPIVFCTAAAREGDQGEAMRAGADAYLRKPIDVPALQRKIRMLLELSALRSGRAQAEAAEVIQDEVRRQPEFPGRRAVTPQSAITLERRARARAYAVFLENGGTQGHFQRWWPGALRAALLEAASNPRPSNTVVPRRHGREYVLRT